MPKQRPLGIYKKYEYKAFKIWLSIPRRLRGLPEQSLQLSGIHDFTIRQIATIATQKEFARRFRIKDLGTLTDWKKKIEEEEPNMKMHPAFLMIHKNLLVSLYRKILRDGRPAE